MVLPMAIGRSKVELRKAGEARASFRETISGERFGTSIPIVPFPGIGAIIRIPKADKLKAISSSSDLIFDILTPADGIISYNVTVGPIVASILSILIL